MVVEVNGKIRYGVPPNVRAAVRDRLYVANPWQPPGEVMKQIGKTWGDMTQDQKRDAWTAVVLVDPWAGTRRFRKTKKERELIKRSGINKPGKKRTYKKITRSIFTQDCINDADWGKIESEQTKFGRLNSTYFNGKPCAKTQYVNWKKGKK